MKRQPELILYSLLVDELLSRHIVTQLLSETARLKQLMALHQVSTERETDRQTDRVVVWTTTLTTVRTDRERQGVRETDRKRVRDRERWKDR